MRRLVAVLSLLAGCDFTFNIDHLKDPAPIDGPPDIRADAPGCYGQYGPASSGLAFICLDQAPMDTWTPSGELHTGLLQNPGDCMQLVPQSGANTELCVIYARNITLAGYLPTSGSRPLALIATDTFTMTDTATIGADSRASSGRRGPDANETGCGTPSGTGATTGASGGAGGSFGGKGGNGGKGAGAPMVPANGAVAGIGFVRGGCKGGDGGSGIAGLGSGKGGASGGAVYIIAGQRINIAGTIDASGQFGSGGDQAITSTTGGDGGGGGGSGGFIGLDAPMISIASSANIVANGGGGGGGGAGNGGSGSKGGDGTEAQLSMPPDFPAPGGTGGSAGGGGGDGASGATPATAGATDGSSVARSAGGGGGGGAGVIQFFTGMLDNQSVNISPPPS